MRSGLCRSTGEDIEINEYLHSWSAYVAWECYIFGPQHLLLWRSWGAMKKREGENHYELLFLSSRVGQQFRLAF